LTEENQAESNKVRKMAETRELLERRIREIETELEGLRSLMDVLNGVLLEKGFKRADFQKAAPEPAPAPSMEEAWPPTPIAKVEEPELSAAKEEHVVPFKTVTGDLLANLYVSKDSMRIVIAEDKRFTVDVPPFMAFLVERVLAKMQEKDKEAAAAGELMPDQILSYEIVRDGDVLREITIRNVGEDRARELKSTIRWTLEKMYEKMKSSA
jgi:hypothetical protein